MLVYMSFEIEIPQTYKYTFTIPLEFILKRYIMVKNTGNKLIQLGVIAKTLEVPENAHAGPTLFPQGLIESGDSESFCHLYLGPKESELVWFFVDEPRIWPEDILDSAGHFIQDWQDPEFLRKKEGEYTRTVRITVIPIDDRSGAKTVDLKHTVKVVPLEKLEETAVWGKICDENDEPLAGVNVNLDWEAGSTSSSVPDRNGSYRIPCPARIKYQLSVTRLGYEAFHRFIKPLEKQPMMVNVRLDRGEKVDYKVVRKAEIDAGTQCSIYRASMSRDERFIVLGSGYNKPPATKTYVYFFDTDGNFQWKYPMEGEVWAVDVSDNGEYVAAASLGNSDHGLRARPPGAEAFLFSNTGEVLWKTDEPGQSREVRISHNNEYVAIGGMNGYVYLYNLKKNSLIWKKYTYGQVRGIKFKEDDSRIYVGSGSNYLETYEIDGSLLWRTCTAAWPYSSNGSFGGGLVLSPDESLLAIASKVGPCTLLDSNGNILWSVDSERDAYWASISPNNAYISFGSCKTVLNTSLFDTFGNHLWRTSSSYSGTFTSDGEKILIATDDGIKLLNLRGTPIWSDNTRTVTRFCSITKDQSRIISADTKGFLYIYKKSP
jgi:hypothetical protein